MALRVLLADESPTIKKVMQLALQDFAVEVKNVPAGAEVLAVAKAFKPDIVFVDVLLPKRSGYDVCSEIRADSILSQVPVVLMWSGFMALDSSRASKVGSSGKLEKPFDADTLRGLVTSLVPKTTTNPVSQFLQFPDLPQFLEDEGAQPSEPVPMELPDTDDIPQELKWQGQAPIPPVPEKKPNSGQSKSDIKPPDFVINEDDEVVTVIRPMKAVENPPDKQAPIEENILVIPEEFESEEFSESPIVTPKTSQQFEDNDDNEWMRQDLSKFKITEDAEDYDFAKKFVIPESELDIENLHLQNDGSFAEISFEPKESGTQSPAKSSKNIPGSAPQAGLRDQEEVIPRAIKKASANQEGQIAGSSGRSTSLNEEILKVLSAEKIEEILQTQSREIIESIAWKVLPEIIERVVREELDKLLREVDNNI